MGEVWESRRGLLGYEHIFGYGLGIVMNRVGFKGVLGNGNC